MTRTLTSLACAALLALLSGLASPAAAQTDIINTWAGGGPTPGSSALTASLGTPNSVAIDLAGNTYVAATARRQIFKIDAAGLISVFAGGGTLVGTAADGGPATAAALSAPSHLVWRNDHLFVVSSPGIRRIDTLTGTITTVLGGGTQSFSNGMLATTLTSACVSGLAVAATGRVYTTDPCDHTIKSIDLAGRYGVVAGTQGVSGFSGDGAALNAILNRPFEVAVASTGTLAILDQGHDRSSVRARLITPGVSGVVDTSSGSTITSVTSGGCCNIGPASNGQDALTAQMGHLTAVGFDGMGALVVAQSGPDGAANSPAYLWRIDPAPARTLHLIAGGDLATAAGAPTYGDGGSALTARLGLVAGFVSTPTAIVVADSALSLVRRIEAGNIDRIAGNGQSSYAGDGGPAIDATLFQPTTLTFDPAGNAYVIDQTSIADRNPVLRVIAAGTGTISTIAATPPPPPAAPFTFHPTSVAVHPVNGLIYFVNNNEDRIRSLDRVTGAVSIVAGTGVRTCSFDCEGGDPRDDLKDDGPAIDSTFRGPSSLAFDAGGNLFLVDVGNHRVRRIDAGTGRVTTIVGIDIGGNGGFDPPGQTQLRFPRAVAIGPDGQMYLADTGNRRILTAGSSAPGLGPAGFSSPSTLASGVGVALLAVDGTARLFYSELGEHSVRVMSAAGGSSSIYVNSSRLDGFVGDGGPALNARLTSVWGLAYSGGALHIADSGNNRIRRVAPPTTGTPPTANSQSLTTAFGTPITITLTGISPSGAPLSIPALGTPAHGTLTAVSATTYIYTPDPGYSGPDSFTFVVSDGTLSSPPATISITVLPNQVPTAMPQSVSTGYLQPLTITVTGSDPETDPLTFALASSPTGGVLTAAGPGSWSYQPNAGFSGADSFTFTAADPYGVSTPALVQITVVAPGATPVGTNVAVQATDLGGALQPVTVTFSQVTTAGVTHAIPVVAPPPPANFQVNGLVYDITTTAVYVPPVRVCFAGVFGATDQILHYVAGTWVPLTNMSFSPVSGPPFTQICGDSPSLSPFVVARPTQIPSQPTISVSAPIAGGTYVLNQVVQVAFTCTGQGAPITTCTGTQANGGRLDTASVGDKTLTVSATDALGRTATQVVTYRVVYASGGVCFGEAGHSVLFPIAANGSSVFLEDLPVLARFRVCDAGGRPVGTGVVRSFRLIETTVDGVTTPRDEVVPSAVQSAFRWEPLTRQWYFLIDTRRYVPGLHTFRIALADGSSIDFRFTVRAFGS